MLKKKKKLVSSQDPSDRGRKSLREGKPPVYGSGRGPCPCSEFTLRTGRPFVEGPPVDTGGGLRPTASRPTRVSPRRHKSEVRTGTTGLDLSDTGHTLQSSGAPWACKGVRRPLVVPGSGHGCEWPKGLLDAPTYTEREDRRELSFPAESLVRSRSSPTPVPRTHGVTRMTPIDSSSREGQTDPG